jgi:endonuclease/exonuclease/phosphatase (EEP) superfamily protein YafD
MRLLSAIQALFTAIEPLIPWIVSALLLLSVTPYFGRRHNLLELTSHFRLQYFLAAVFGVGFCLPFGKWEYVVPCLAAAVINLWAIVPLYRRRLSEAKLTGQPVKLIFANVLYSNRAHDRFIAWVQRQDFDLLVVQEVDEQWTKSLEVLREHHGFCLLFPREAGSGIALYSRIPFEQLPIDIPEVDLRPGILVKLNAGNAPAYLVSVHPLTPILPKDFRHRNATLAAAATCLQGLNGQKIFVGDLNCSPWSPTFQDFERQTNLVSVRKGSGVVTSWPTFMGFRWLMIPIDHCLVSSDIRVVNVRTGDRIGSDHFPLMVDIEI